MKSIFCELKRFVLIVERLDNHIHVTLVHLFVHDMRKFGVHAIPHDVDFITDFQLGAVITVYGVDDFAVLLKLAEKTTFLIGEASDKLCFACIEARLSRGFLFKKKRNEADDKQSESNN